MWYKKTQQFNSCTIGDLTEPGIDALTQATQGLGHFFLKYRLNGVDISIQTPPVVLVGPVATPEIIIIPGCGLISAVKYRKQG